MARNWKEARDAEREREAELDLKRQGRQCLKCGARKTLKAAFTRTGRQTNELVVWCVKCSHVQNWRNPYIPPWERKDMEVAPRWGHDVTVPALPDENADAHWRALRAELHDAH